MIFARLAPAALALALTFAAAACGDDSKGGGADTTVADTIDGDATGADTSGDATVADTSGADTAGDTTVADTAITDTTVADTAGDTTVADTAGDTTVADTAGDTTVADTAGDTTAADTAGDTTAADTADGDTSTGACDHNGFTAVAQDAGAAFGAFFYVGQSTQSSPVDVLSFEIVADLGGATEAGSYPLTGENYADCSNCVLVYGGCDDDLDNCTKTFLAQSGTLNITSFGATGELFAGTLDGVVLAEVTIAGDYTSTVVPGGQTWCLDGTAFSATVQ